MEQKYIIGDLCEYEGVIYAVYNVDLLYFGSLLLTDGENKIFRTSKEVNPIPINDKILTKNGWYKPFKLENIWKKGELIIYDCREKKGAWSVKITGFNDNFYFKYVHELQHILFALHLDSGMKV